MQKLRLVLSIAGLVLACESGPVTASHQPAAGSSGVSSGVSPGAPKPGADNPNAAPAPGALVEPGAGTPKITKSYGGAFESVPEVKLSAIVANPSAYSDKTVIVEGKVQRACSRKGCWMEIGEGADACRVTFKDYAFFVPTNSAGAHARLQGRVETSQVEPAAVEHLESEGARFQSKGKDGTATEVRLVASAVQLTR